MSIEPTIRERLLSLPQEYWMNVQEQISHHGQLARTRQAMEARKTNLMTDLAREWAETKSNEQTRNAQVGQALLADGPYQDMITAGVSLEEALKADQLRMDALRFERDILVCIANNDGANTQ